MLTIRLVDKIAISFKHVYIYSIVWINSFSGEGNKRWNNKNAFDDIIKSYFNIINNFNANK